MWHTALITLHAASALVAFAAGCIAIWRVSSFKVYFWSLVAMLAFLVAVVAVDWSGLDTPSRVLYSVLIALAGYMIVSAAQARRIVPAAPSRPSASYLDHLGFTLVALFDGFIIIAALSLGAPVWLAVAVGVIGAVGGHITIRTLKTRLAAS